MNKYLILILLVGSAAKGQDDIGSLFDRVFKEQEKLMDRMFDSHDWGDFDSLDISPSSDIKMSSVVKDINGKTYEEVTIEAAEEGQDLTIKIGDRMTIHSVITQSEQSANGSFTSHRSHSQSFPLPEGGQYIPSMDKVSGKAHLYYFEVPKGKLAESWQAGGEVPRRLRFGNPNQNHEQEDRGVILPQKQI